MEISATSGYNTTTPQSVPMQQLDMVDFLKLLTTQLTNQDPLKPMEDTAFIAQMAQFSSLQQMQNLNDQFTQLKEQQEWLSSQQLIGKKVTYVDEEGSHISGIVNSSAKEGNQIQLLIGSEHVPLAAIIQIHTTTESGS